MPDYELERCEYCARPDWEAGGDCLARVRVSANALGALAIALGDIYEACIGRRDAKSYRALQAIGEAEEQLRRLGIDADEYRAHRKRRWARLER